MNVIACYFDERASSWMNVEERTKSPLQDAAAIIGGVGEGARVLDVGCGLGAMVPVYLQLGAQRVLAVDISEQMVELARERWKDQPGVELLCADATDLQLDEQFDSIIIYNAYLHFCDRPALARTCHGLLADGGRFIVAQGASKESINAHSELEEAGISFGLKPAKEEAAAWEGLFAIDAIIDTPGFYAFAGSKVS